ncbi:MAG: cation:proton antiporter [Candidatus Aenigmatarchaeota archaeon]|nr:MAG: cation:proton antiporter [Candidatus Aenigmarchaeota archaeon]
MALDAVSLSVMYFAILLGFGVLVANLLKKRNIPDTFFLLLLGLLFSPTVTMNPVIMQYISIDLVDVKAMGTIPDFLRTLALIMVIFVGTFNLNFGVFKRYSNISIKLAFAGVIFNTVILGLAAYFLFNIDIIFALLMGAVISGTGTGVVFAFEKALSHAKSALTILKVESIFNSPLSVLLPLIFLDLVAGSGTPGAIIEPLKYVSQFWQMITVGVGTGLIIGLAASRMFRGILSEYTPLMLFSIALITYALSTGVGGSGMLAVAICGLVAGNFTLKGREDKKEILHFQDHFSEMLRISVFTLLGAQVTLLFGMQELFYILFFFMIVVLIRPVMLMFLMGELREKFSKKEITLMSFIAPRGLSAAAMIPIVAAAVIGAGQPAVAEQMVNIVFMIILLTVFFSTIVGAIGSLARFGGKKRRTKKEEKEVEQEPEIAIKKEDDISPMIEYDDTGG